MKIMCDPEERETQAANNLPTNDGSAVVADVEEEYVAHGAEASAEPRKKVPSEGSIGGHHEDEEDEESMDEGDSTTTFHMRAASPGLSSHVVIFVDYLCLAKVPLPFHSVFRAVQRFFVERSVVPQQRMEELDASWKMAPEAENIVVSPLAKNGTPAEGELGSCAAPKSNVVVQSWTVFMPPGKAHDVVCGDGEGATVAGSASEADEHASFLQSCGCVVRRCASPRMMALAALRDELRDSVPNAYLDIVSLVAPGSDYRRVVRDMGAKAWASVLFVYGRAQQGSTTRVERATRRLRKLPQVRGVFTIYSDVLHMQAEQPPRKGRGGHNGC